MLSALCFIISFKNINYSYQIVISNATFLLHHVGPCIEFEKEMNKSRTFFFKKKALIIGM
jgi:hypothetical protein